MNHSERTTPQTGSLFRKTEFRIFLATFLVLLFFICIGPGRTQGARVMAHAHALLYEHRNAIDTYHWNTIDKSYYDNHYYTSAGPGMGYLAVPSLIVCDAILRLVPEHVATRLNEKIRVQLEKVCAPQISFGYVSFDPAKNKSNLFEFHVSIWFFEFFISFLAAGTAVIFYRTLRWYAVDGALAVRAAMLLTLGTILLFYSRMGYSVAPSSFLLVTGFYFIARAGNAPRAAGGQFMRLCAAGAALGASVTLEYIQIIGAVLIFLFAWQKLGLRRAAIVGLGGIPFGLMILWFQYAEFGNAFATPYKYVIPFFEESHSLGILGLTFPNPGRVLALVFGFRRGMFVYTPVLLFTFILAIRNLFGSRERKGESMLIIALFTGYLLFQAASPLVGETWGIGPRYAAPIVPFALFGLIFIAGNVELRTFRWFAAVSLAINWLMVQRDIEARNHAAPLWDALLAFLHHGPSSDVLEESFSLLHISNPLVTWLIGFIAYACLFGVLYFVWPGRESAEPGDVQAAPATIGAS